MEYQHSTSDGRGFEEFIRCVLFNYLKLCGKPVENDGTVRGLDSVYTIKESEDAYSHLADSYSSEGIYQKPAALHAEELTDVGDQPEVITEVTFPFEQLHKAAKSMGASPLSVIAPLFSRAFRQKFGKDSDAPVISQIPVALRPYVPSATTRYFICFLDLPYEASYDDLPLEEVCRRTKAFLKDQMLPERLLFRAKRASDVCRELHERDIPLAEKEAEAANLSKNFVLEDSFLITNVGEFRLPESMKPYVLDYGAVLPCASQPCAMLVLQRQHENFHCSARTRPRSADHVQQLSGISQCPHPSVQLSLPRYLVRRHDGFQGIPPVSPLNAKTKPCILVECRAFYFTLPGVHRRSE